METHGIKFKDKFGYALGDMGFWVLKMSDGNLLTI